MQRFYMIRHGETDWNIARKLQGHSNILLNQKGQDQARSLGERMRSVPITKVISSDLDRALETAQIAFGYVTEKSTQLREVSLGEAEGLTKDDIIPRYGLNFWENWTSPDPQHHDLRFPQGESKSEMIERLQKTLHHFLDRHPQDTIAFVSHGLLMRTFTHLLRPELKETHFIENCGVLQLARDPSRNFIFNDYFDQSRKVTESDSI